MKSKTRDKLLRYFFYLGFFGSVILLLLSFILFYYNVWNVDTANANLLISVELLFFFSVFSYLLARGWNLKRVAKSLGLTAGRLRTKQHNREILRLAAVTMMLFALAFLFEIGLSLFSTITNIPLPTNVAQALAGLPAYFLVFSVVITPICEETLFRGFLMPRIGIISGRLSSFVLNIKLSPQAVSTLGIVVSAIIFAIAHLGYGSIAEFSGALFFGLIAGWVFREYNTIYPSILAHAAVNAIGLLAIIIIVR